MAEKEALELGLLKIKIPVEYSIIKAIEILDEANQYGRMSLTLVVGDEEKDSVVNQLKEQVIQVDDPDGEVIFSGVCVQAELEHKDEYTELHVGVCGHAWLTTKTPNTRTFQLESKTLKDVADKVMEGYQVNVGVKENITIKELLSQENETDWDFLKRIANQYGMLVFTDSKSDKMRIHLGVVPFSSKDAALLEEMTEVSHVKDIDAFLKVRENTKPDASVFEFAKTEGISNELLIGSGHTITGGTAPMVITRSIIKGIRGVVVNRLQVSYEDGAVAGSMRESVMMETIRMMQRKKLSLNERKFRSLQKISTTGDTIFTRVLIGKVLEVEKANLKVEFAGNEETRWIPYETVWGNDMYGMPDVDDMVYCHYQNNGELVVLGSKRVSDEPSDFGKPEERVLTAYNRMIKMKKKGLDITANRKVYDGESGNQVDITFQDDDGIKVAATKSVKVNIIAKEDMNVEAKKAIAIIGTESCSLMVGSSAILFGKGNVQVDGKVHLNGG